MELKKFWQPGYKMFFSHLTIIYEIFFIHLTNLNPNVGTFDGIKEIFTGRKASLQETSVTHFVAVFCEENYPSNTR